MWSTEMYKIEKFIQSKEKEWLIFLNPRLSRILYNKDYYKDFNFFVDKKSFLNMGFVWGYHKNSLNMQIFYKNEKIADSTITVCSHIQLGNNLTPNIMYHLTDAVGNSVVVYQDFWVVLIPKNISFIWNKYSGLIEETYIEDIDIYSSKWEFLYSVNKKLGKDLQFSVKDNVLNYVENEQDKICLLLKDRIIDNINDNKFCTDWILHYNYIINSTKDDKIVYVDKGEIQELPFPTLKFLFKTYEYLSEYNENEYKKIDFLYAKSLDYTYYDLVLRNSYLSFEVKDDNSEELQTKYKQLEENLKSLGWEVEKSYSDSKERTFKIGYIPEIHLFMSWNIVKYLKKIDNTIYFDRRDQKIKKIERFGDFEVLKENIDSIKLSKIKNKKGEFNGFLSISNSFNLTIYDKNLKEISKLDLRNVLWDIKEVQDIIIAKEKFDKLFWSNIFFVWKIWSEKWIFINKENLSVKVVNIWLILNFSSANENINLRKKLMKSLFSNELSTEENNIFNKPFNKRRIKTTLMEDEKRVWKDQIQYMLKNIDCLVLLWIKWINTYYKYVDKKLPEECSMRKSYMLDFIWKNKNLLFSLDYDTTLMIKLTNIDVEEMKQRALNTGKYYYLLQDNWKLNYFQ